MTALCNKQISSCNHNSNDRDDVLKHTYDNQIFQKARKIEMAVLDRRVTIHHYSIGVLF